MRHQPNRDRPGRQVAANRGCLVHDTRRVGCRWLFNKLQRGDAGTGRQVALATCGCSSVGRARPRQGRGHEFETRHPLHVGCVRAQAPVRLRACACPRCGTRAAMRLVHRAPRVWAQPTWIPMSRSSSGPGHRAFNSEITGSTPVRDARQEPSALARLEGGNRPQRLGGAGTRHRTLHRGCSSDGRAPALQAEGRRFEAGHLHQFSHAPLTQWPECRPV